MKYWAILLLIVSAACSPPTPPKPTATPMNENPATAAQVATPPEYVEDTTIPLMPASTEGAKLAQKVAALERPFGSPENVLTKLGMPVTGFAGTRYQTGKPSYNVDTHEGRIVVTLILQPGTWEPPRGNSAPRFEPPVVQAVQVSGPTRLEFEVPQDAKQVTADGSGELHHLKMWDGFTYFEQGSAPKSDRVSLAPRHDGWTVTRSMVRADFHRLLAEEKALEDAVLKLVDPLAAGVDVQALLAKDFAANRVGDSQIYDFGAGKIEATPPGVLQVSWLAPTKVSAIFKHFGVEMLQTSFAHDAGQMSQPIKLENLTIYPIDYFIRRPELQEAELGSAKDASFRSMQFAHNPGQSREAQGSALMPRR